MKIAYVIGPGRGDTDLLLASAVEQIQAAGVRVCGTVQVNTMCEGEGPCDMDVRVLPDGPVIRISQSLGPEARGCRLDAGALETAIAASEQQLGSADVLVVNKFGKQEAAGRGFRGLIGEALTQDMPVLVGLNAMNMPAFAEFTGDAAVQVAPDQSAVVNWLLDAVEQGAS